MLLRCHTAVLFGLGLLMRKGMADYEDEFENASDEENSRSKQPPPVAATVKFPATAVAVPVPVPVPVAVPVPVPVASTKAPIPAPINVASPVAQKTEAERAVEAALDSGMWKKQFDAGSQKHYYFHVLTKATTWNLAEELGFGEKKVPSLALGFGSDTGSTIVSPQENPILLKLPAKFRSNSMFGDEPARSASPEADEGSSPGVKDDGGGKQFQQLSRFQAFGSVSPAGGTDDGAGDEVKADSLTSSPTAVRSETHRAAAAAREGFRQAVKHQPEATVTRPSVSFAFGAGGSESAVSDPREDPADGKGAFGEFAVFKAFNSDQFAGSVSGTGNAEEAEKRQSSQFLAAAKQPTKAADAQPTKSADKGNSDDSSSAFSTASQAIAKRVVTPTTVDPKELPSAKTAGQEGPATNNHAQKRAPLTLQTTLSPTSPIPAVYVAPMATISPGVTPAAVNPQQKPSVFSVPQFSTYVVPTTRHEEPNMMPPIAIGSQPLVPDRGFGAASTTTAVANPPAVDSKLIELRETTEAVERLVRAFAHLRGVEPSQSAAERAASYVAEAGARGLHQTQFNSRKSAARTLTTSEDRTNTNDLLSSRRRAEHQFLMRGNDDLGDLGIHRMHEEMLETTIVDCVLDMMANDFQRRVMPKKRAATSTAASSSSLPYPARLERESISHETVTIDQYRRFTDPNADASLRGGTWKQSATTGLTRHDPYQVFESPFTTWRSPHGSSGLGEGEQSLATLAHEALNKYVLRHLVLGTLHPPLVRLMLVDLMSACMDAALRCFGSDDLSPASVPMVLLRFDGAEKDVALATQICHALPLEVIDTADTARASSTGSSRRRVFRVEHWVCRIHMLTIVKALQSALRQAEAIDADAYRTFKASRANSSKRSPCSALQDGDNEVFIPQERCLFSVFTDPDAHASASSEVPQTASSAVPASGGSTTKNSSQLREAIEAPLSAIVESIASILPTHPVFDVRESEYVGDIDQRECVVETIGELLQDVDIRRALEKRASQKLLARALKRKEDNGNGSATRQGERDRREEQLRILREAEDRASKMVEEIRAEMAASNRNTKR